MAKTATYSKIASYTVPSSQASYEFTSIPGTYTDLIIVGSVKLSNNADSSMAFRVNGDTGSNYSYTYFRGDGSTTESGRASNATVGNFSGGNFRVADSSSNYSPIMFHMMDYSSTSVYKTFLNRGNNASAALGASVSLWRSTSAITSILIYPFAGTIDTGSTFTLYGIEAAK